MNVFFLNVGFQRGKYLKKIVPTQSYFTTESHFYGFMKSVNFIIIFDSDTMLTIWKIKCHFLTVLSTLLPLLPELEREKVLNWTKIDHLPVFKHIGAFTKYFFSQNGKY